MATGTLNAIDYSFAAPNIAQAAADGINLFCRYLSPSSGKDFTAAEIKQIHTHGKAALPLWEGYANDALRGYGKGHTDGLAAWGSLSALHNSVGYSPKNKPGIAFAVDFDTNSGDWAELEAYFRGVRAAVGTRILIGCYGEAAILDHLIALHLIDFGFQTYAWSGGVVSPNAHLYQYLNGQNFCGGQVDYCEIRNLSKLGAWFPPGSQNDNNGTEEDMTPEQLPAAMVEALKNPAVVRQLRVALGMVDAKGNGHGIVGLLSRIRRGDWVAYFDDKGKPVK